MEQQQINYQQIESELKQIYPNEIHQLQLEYKELIKDPNKSQEAYSYYIQQLGLYYQQYQQELSTAHNEAMEDFYTRVRAAIATIAKKEHFELVLQKDAAPFAAEKLDVTKQVITAIK